MMTKINYIQGAKRFWQSRKKSRTAVDKGLASRPPAEQIAIKAKMLANHKAMRDAKKIT
ncbi:hypothetical protein ACFLX7_01625 [Chloroflexota bacterium]